MLKQVRLQKFRKHEDLVVSFTEGLNAIRAANEGGKTTVIEAISYAFFGSKVLRDGLENTVTWGHKPSELKVEVEYGDFTVVRSKGGAEVRSMGQVHVTGQTDVTQFCENLLGADANTAANLMLSNQMGLRGILTNGPKATAQLIEDLGEFDLFDKILDRAAHSLALGASSIQADRLNTLVTTLEGLEVPEKPDEAAHAAHVGALDLALAAEKGKVDGLVAEARVLREDLGGLRQAKERHLQVSGALAKVMARLRDLEAERDSVRAEASLKPKDTSGLEEEVRQARDNSVRRRAYAQFQTIPVLPREPRAQIEELRKQLALDGAEATTKLNEAQKALAVARSQLVTSSVCGFCGQDVSQFPEAAKRNAELQAKIEQLTGAVGNAQDDLKHIDEAKAELRQRDGDDDKVSRAVRGIEQYVEIDDATLPATVTWKGLPPPAESDEPDYGGMLADAKRYNDAILKASTKLEMLNRQISDLDDDRLKLTAELESTPHVSDEDIGQVEAAVQRGDEAIADLQRLLTEAQRSIDSAKSDFKLRSAAYASAIERRSDLERQIESTKKEIETLEFNNNLVKKIRAARPVISNKLWAMVLSSVSTVFSQMRGEKSVVAKEKDGFTVNGRSIDSLSGSTLDLLGLAIRSALVKTFVPGCPFFILDEPSAAMDDNRTAAMLGYIAASGFSQVLLVTHEDVSESFANNLITL